MLTAMPNLPPLPQGPFQWRGRALAAGALSLESLARRFGTPLFVMSADAIRERIRDVRAAFAPERPVISYAMKANATLGVLRVFVREGCGIEVVSGGELARALAAGADPGKIVFSGVGKTGAEIAAALRARIFLFDVESVPELEAIARVANRLGVRARVAFRVNPHVDADTHRYITTGTHENKFGIDWTLAEAAFVKASRMRGIDLAGIHTHIGSQITKPGPFLAAANRIDGLLGRLERRGVVLRIRNLGGGMGISYRPGQRRVDATAVARLIRPFLQRRRMQLVLEPGRYAVGEAGVLLTRVIYVKQGVRKRFAIVDAAMNDLIRPPLYEAHHEIVPVRPRAGRGARVDIVGPVCESGDFLGKDRDLAPLRPGDTLAVLSAGAYGSVMSSNYNARPRAAEVLVDGKTVKLIRRRETIRDLMRGE